MKIQQGNSMALLFMLWLSLVSNAASFRHHSTLQQANNDDSKHHLRSRSRDENNSNVNTEQDEQDVFANVTTEQDGEVDIFANCTTWTSHFGNSRIWQDDTVVIDANVCLFMDLPDLYLAKGLEIDGILVIDRQFTLETTYIQITGEFHMTAPSSVVNGTPDIRILMIGTDEYISVFGKKSITVDGGRIVWNGWSEDAPTWVKLQSVIVEEDPQYTTKLVLSNSTVPKWGVGAEILITSHTLDWDNQQVAIIKSVDNDDERYPGHAVYELEEPIRRPTTMEDDPEFAVEVALLSRNIQLMGADDDEENQFHGAHFQIFLTTRSDQLIQGCEFNNFGQQGTIARYPIHIHVCDDVFGSEIRKNTIRKSNQRCVVVHGTHRLLVEQNIAYDTKGHCFITEDGFEEGNRFVNNLGALTQVPETIIPNEGTNGIETDDKPATFWMVNPNNDMIGNVAAGSEGSGFWWELSPQVRGDFAMLYPHLNPMTRPLGYVANNVAHSNSDRAFRLYPNGFTPELRAKFYDTKSYRNRQNGIFVHNSNNVEFAGGIVADNRVAGCDFDRAEAVALYNFTVIGVSDSYKQLQQDQSGIPGVCNRNGLRGIELHTYIRDAANAVYDQGGAVLENITFSGYADCNGSTAIWFDDQTFTTVFDYYATVKNITFLEPGISTMDFCDAEAADIDHIFVVDLDSSLIPDTLELPEKNGNVNVDVDANATIDNTTITSVLVSNRDYMTDLIDPAKCQTNEDLCHVYCVDTCLRTVIYKVEPAATEDWKLRVCHSSGTPCAEIPGQPTTSSQGTPEAQFLRSTKVGLVDRAFHVAVPNDGPYTVSFLDGRGRRVWPAYIHRTMDDARCDDAIGAADMILDPPPLGQNECRELVRNRGGNDSGDVPVHWLHRGNSGIRVRRGQGIDRRQNALGDTNYNSASSAIAQYVDVRCFAANYRRTYRVQAWVKLTNRDGTSTFRCSGRNCPSIGILAHSSAVGSEYGVSGNFGSIPGRFTGEIRSDGYHKIQGSLEVTDALASADQVYIYVRKNRANSYMIVGDVSMSLV